ncbi:hypothetical protein CYY_004082 [Polysphondylium violaceum]|uniref:N-acetyltransferase domain-containing protein n=1 Tax=Polysphondylium violaceum TaxID=133409 RepID=A0A8J4V5J4_9MYCE|nr:hypothetical protein CYY_004082 [Polysphondylium violaceum]
MVPNNNSSNNNSIDNIILKLVTIDDILELQKIGRQTFYETFSAGNTEENMKKYLEEGFEIQKLIAEIHNTDSPIYFSIFDGRVIGYLKVNFGESQTELQDSKALEIERIYVIQEFQGRGVGQILYNKAIEIAKEKDVEYVWLGVWEFNPKALSFYKKNGFVEFSKHIFQLGDDKQTDIMMKIKLNK